MKRRQTEETHCDHVEASARRRAGVRSRSLRPGLLRRRPARHEAIALRRLRADQTLAPHGRRIAILEHAAWPE